ncbi:MAG: helix-turn-helix domain-containing protein [Bacteroidales bacterium]|nr:helix-turn-helix domain-containing protein [Bacteroidales bacterium]
MRSKVADRILSKTPEETKIFARLYSDLIMHINRIIKEKGYSQKSLADKMEKSPSEIHKWLSAEHNFTLRSIAKLQAELGEELLIVPVRKPVFEFNSKFVKTTYSVTVYSQTTSVPDKSESWTEAEPVVDSSKELKNAA